MPLDALTLTHVVHELRGRLEGGRIDKVFQPEKDEVQLLVRGGGNVRLLLSASPAHARIHLTAKNKENPAVPPMFCMLLRKHLVGARIRSVSMPQELERMVRLELDTTDEMGEPVTKALVAELMGRHSNIILVDGEGRIVDCLRRVDTEMSERRPVLPGLFYRLPPREEDKMSPFGDEKALRGRLAEMPQGAPVDKWLLDAVYGLSPLLCREVAHRALGAADARLEGDADDVAGRLMEALGALNPTQETQGPVMLLEGGRPRDFSCTPIAQYGGLYALQTYDSYSELLDDFFAVRDTQQRMRQRAQDMIRTMTTLRERTRRRIASQQKEFEDTNRRELLRQKGDLIMANLYALKHGLERVSLDNFYDEAGGQIEIRLDPQRTPQQNAARYYKDYNRAKTAAAVLAERIGQGERELEYFDSVLEALERAASQSELDEIRQELAAGRYLRSAKGTGGGRKQALKPPGPARYTSSTGRAIYVGRNNLQNDQLTMKLARGSDIWLHTQKIHGSHVIIDCREGPPDDRTLYEAACLAAANSAAKTGTKIPVDYTQARYVKKPPGAKPGMVIYDNYKTMLAEPADAPIERT